MHKHIELKASPAGGMQGLALYAQQHITIHQHKQIENIENITTHQHQHVGVHLQSDQQVGSRQNKNA